MTTLDFEERLDDLINEGLKSGMTLDQIYIILEMQLIEMDEDVDDESVGC